MKELSDPLSHESLVSEIKQRLQVFAGNLPLYIDAPALSRSKLPLKALSYREALVWRATELGQAAMENFDAERLVAAILLTRAAVETTAAIWYLSNKINLALKTDSIVDLDDCLMKLCMGNRIWKDTPDAINILTFVDSMDKMYEGFKEQYDFLSEFAHPNYSGVLGLYSMTVPGEFTTSFGRCARSWDVYVGISNLSVALMIFEGAYNELTDLMPDFVTLCEKGLEGRTSTAKSGI